MRQETNIKFQIEAIKTKIQRLEKIITAAIVIKHKIARLIVELQKKLIAHQYELQFLDELLYRYSKQRNRR